MHLRKPFFPLFVLALLVVPTLLVLPASAEGEALQLLSSELPAGRNDLAASSSATHVYYFGGGSSSGSTFFAYDEIVRLDPATGNVTVMGARLPTPRSYVSAVGAGNASYVFGGCNDSSQCRVTPSSDIVKYDHASDTASVVASFITPRLATSAVWTGRHAYVFGGDQCAPHMSCPLTEIVRFDPSDNSVRVMNATIPQGSIASGAAWDGRYAYIFGGLVSPLATTSRILRYDPQNDTLTTLSTTLPTARYWLSATWIGDKGYVFGGHSDAGFLGEVVEFDPAAGTTRTLPGVTFPTARYAVASASFGEDSAYVTGGWDGTNRIKQIHRFSIDLGRPDAPLDVSVARGPSWDRALVTWSPPADAGAEPITDYEVYRKLVPGGVDQLLGRVGNTTLYADTGLACGATYDYTVRAVNARGPGPASSPFRSAPDPLLHLLCRMNQEMPEFHWGPVALDDSAGWPDAQPVTLAEIDERLAATGEHPVWFNMVPGKASCCLVLALDGNLLRPGQGDFSFAPMKHLRSLTPDAAHGFLDNIEDIGTISGTFGGMQNHHKPFLLPALGNAPAVASDARVAVSVESDDFPSGGAEGLVGGHLYLDGNVLRRSLPDTVVAQARVPGPTYGFEREFNQLHVWDVLGYKFEAGLRTSVDFDIDTEANAALGGMVETGSVKPKLLLAGVGAELGVEASAVGKALIIVGGSVTTHGSTGLGVRGEVVAPFGNGLAPGEQAFSEYSGVTYQNVRGPVATLLLTGMHLEFEPAEACFHLRWWDLCAGADLPGIEFPAAGISAGPARVHSTIPLRTVLGASSAPMSMQEAGLAQMLAGGSTMATMEASSEGDPWNGTLELAADEQDVLLRLEGQPNETTTIHVERAIGWYGPNGTYHVSSWNVTIPNVSVGADGTATLHMDTMAVQREVQDMTRQGGLGFEAAKTEANARIDLNGDGVGDLAAGGAPANPADPTRLGLQVAEKAFVGESFGVSALVQRVASGAAVEGGVVGFYLDGVLAATATTGADGTATATLSLAALALPGVHEVEAVYAGNASVGASRAYALRDAIDRAPTPTIDAFEPLEPVAAPNGVLTIGFSDAESLDLDLSSAAVRVDNGSWIPAPNLTAALDVGPSGLNITDGFHQVDVRVADLAGNVGMTPTMLVLDTHAPTVQRSAGPILLGEGSSYTIAWTADEPVVGRLILTPALGGGNVTASSAGFATLGTLSAGPLPVGVYTVTLEYLDTAARAPEGLPTTLPDVTVVAPLL